MARRAHQVDCPKCGWPTLVGLDADLIAGTAVINPTPISTTQEVTEWSAGRHTYTYDTLTGKIDRRDQDTIRPHPATRGDVHATHTCDRSTQ